MNDNNKDFLELKERDRHGCYTQRCLSVLEQVLLCTIKSSGFYQESDHNNSHKFLSNFNHSKIKGSCTGLEYNAMEVFVSLL